MVQPDDVARKQFCVGNHAAVQHRLDLPSIYVYGTAGVAGGVTIDYLLR
jgi:hypothetical protein